MCRFIRQDPDEKFVFDKTVYLKGGQDLPGSIDLHGIAVTGGQASVFSEGLLSRHHVTFVSSKAFAGTSKQYFIGRLFCPGSGDIITEAAHNLLGYVGIMRIHHTGSAGLLEEGRPAAKWVQKVDIASGHLRDDTVFALEYDPENQKMKLLSFGQTGGHRTISTELTVPTGDGDSLFLAVELTLKADVLQTLLTVRECNSDVWAQFIYFHPSPDPECVEMSLFRRRGDDDLVVTRFHDIPSRNVRASDEIELDEDGIVRRVRRRLDDDLVARRMHDIPSRNASSYRR